MHHVVIIPTLDPTQITSGSGAPTQARVGIDLLGTKNGSNPTFTTPEKFVNTANVKIVVTWNGRRQYQGTDFVVSESGGAGTGYDTITFTAWQGLGFLPRVTDQLTADYYVA